MGIIKHNTRVPEGEFPREAGVELNQTNPFERLVLEESSNIFRHLGRPFLLTKDSRGLLYLEKNVEVDGATYYVRIDGDAFSAEVSSKVTIEKLSDDGNGREWEYCQSVIFGNYGGGLSLPSRQVVFLKRDGDGIAKDFCSISYRNEAIEYAHLNCPDAAHSGLPPMQFMAQKVLGSEGIITHELVQALARVVFEPDELEAFQEGFSSKLLNLGDS